MRRSLTSGSRNSGGGPEDEISNTATLSPRSSHDSSDKRPSSPESARNTTASADLSSTRKIPIRQSRLRRKQRIINRTSRYSTGSNKNNSSSLKNNALFADLPVWTIVVAGIMAVTFVSVALVSLSYLESDAQQLPGNQAPQHLEETLRQRFFPKLKQSQAGPKSSSSSSSSSNNGSNSEAKSILGLVKSTLKSDKLIDMAKWNSELPFDNPDGGAWKQGWNVQPVPVSATNPLQIFVMPHSHCDPGWLKTFDQYFRQQTTHIITTVVEALLADSRRKFIWAEISYLSWWWELQDSKRQSELKGLLQSGQFEIVTGGWVMPDEANSEYYAMQVQLEEGHDWIRENLGAEHIPQYGWSIDPFGYSPTNAYLLKQHKFKGMLIQRVHYHIKKNLAREKSLEFMWRQTWDKTGEYDMFTHVMPFYSYDVPHTCGPDPSVCCQFDFARQPIGKYGSCPWKKSVKLINADNVEERAMLLLDQYKKKAALYQSRVVLVPLGDDFRYDNEAEAEVQFTSHQMIHDYINENVPGVSIRFGTLSEYFKAVEGSFAPPLLQGSFFTYSDVNEDYWSGYFTSRAFDKALDRQLERALSAAEAMGSTKLELRKPRRELALFQHHDGVTGTAKTHVVEDYAKRLHSAIDYTQKVMLHKLQGTYPTLFSGKSSVQACWVAPKPREMQHNVCGEEAEVVAYNPLSTPQECGKVTVPGKSAVQVKLPCDIADYTSPKLKFDANTGFLIEPFKEEWKVWNVLHGGAYLFFPHQLIDYDTNKDELRIEQGGYIVHTKYWSRQIVERKVPSEFGEASVIDFIYTVHVTENNSEWFVRFSSDVKNNGVFYTDLNGFNFDTHYFRSDMPIQSQVFPMPTHAAIQDDRQRFTVLSEHAQGSASLQDGSIDIFLDRRLIQDDARGLGQGVIDTAPLETRLRVILEPSVALPQPTNFAVTKLCERMWNELQHPLQVFGTPQSPVEA